jgi:hypothetical protein
MAETTPRKKSPEGRSMANDNSDEIWTVESLYRHMLREIEHLKARLDERAALIMGTMSAMTDRSQRDQDLSVSTTQRQITELAGQSQRALDLATVALQRQIADLRIMLDERYATSVKALDAAFQAQQLAMATAFTASGAAVTAALEAAEKAVVKAEVASEKRFDAVNEFRQQLSDQAATFMPRNEAEVSLNRNAELIGAVATGASSLMGRQEAQAMYDRNTERISELAERVSAMMPRTEVEGVRTDLASLAQRLVHVEGKGAGLNAAWIYIIGAISLLGTLFSAYRALSGK